MPEEITPGWLTTALAHSGQIDAGTVARVHVEEVASGPTGLVVRAKLVMSSSSLRGPASMVIKMPTDDEDRLRMMSARGMFHREYHFYRKLASKMPDITPRHYFVETNAESTMGIIGLEDLSEMRTVRHGEAFPMDDAVAAVKALAKLHAQWWGRADLDQHEWLMRPGLYFDGEGMDQFTAAAQAVINDYGDRLSAGVVDLLRLLPGALPLIEHRWGSEPTTLCMGDAQGENMFFSGSGDDIRVRLVDWQTPTRSMGALDIANFLVMTFDPNERRSIEDDLLAEYHSELVARDVSNYTFEQLETDFRWGLFRPMIAMLRAKTLMGDRAIDGYGPRLDALVDWGCGELLG